MFFFFTFYKMEEKILIFEKDLVIKNAFHKSKQTINFDKVDIRKIVISSKNSYDKKCSVKCFIGYIRATNALPSP